MRHGRNTVIFSLLLSILSGLLLCGCDIPFVPPPETLETADFRLVLPRSLHTAGAEDGCDAVLQNRRGDRFLLRDVDDGSAPVSYLGLEDDPSADTGLTGRFVYAGWTEPDTVNAGQCVMHYAAGCEGRLLAVEISAPEKRRKQVRKQLLKLIAQMEYIGLPFGAGTVQNDYFTLTYSADWLPEETAPGELGLRDALAGAVAVRIAALPDETRTPEEMAQEQAARLASTSFSELYRSVEIKQKLRLDQVTWTVTQTYDGGDENADALCTEHCFCREGGVMYCFTLIYPLGSCDEFFHRVHGLKLTFSGVPADIAPQE